MVEQRSTSTETTDASRMEYLLGALTGLSHQDPPPALRERLRLLSHQRLQAGVEPGARAGFRSWLRPAFVVALLAVIGFIAVRVAHLYRSEPLRAGIELRVAPPTEPSSIGSAAVPVVRGGEVKSTRPRHSLPSLAQNTIARRMVVSLPYSNSAIDTGTDATIRVSMSQTELVSLGFPMNATLHDRRVLAELTLGDDGLPRSISVPLPLELVKERK
ncbi:MAG: hypothetical protein QOE55_889 [Acidobacteriaceae bacterium]|nr:hypothetical protein [Acidobacteriaceae bacterium]